MRVSRAAPSKTRRAWTFLWAARGLPIAGKRSPRCGRRTRSVVPNARPAAVSDRQSRPRSACARYDCRRIVWRGGAVSELAVPCCVGRLVDLSDFRQLEAQILRLESQGKADEEIAQILTAKGFRSSQHSTLLASTVQLIRLRHGRLHRYWGRRPRRVAGP